MYGVVYPEQLWRVMTSAEVADTVILFVLGLVVSLVCGVSTLWGPQK